MWEMGRSQSKPHCGVERELLTNEKQLVTLSFVPEKPNNTRVLSLNKPEMCHILQDFEVLCYCLVILLLLFVL